MLCYCMGPQNGQLFCPCVMKNKDENFTIKTQIDLVKNIVDAVKKANPDRSFLTFERRQLKLLEEIGEVSEAYLNVTNSSNNKNKKWDDVFEEATDCLIVAIDIYLTLNPKYSSEIFNITPSYSHEALPEFLLGIPLLMVSCEDKNVEYHYQQIVMRFFEICLMNFPRLFFKLDQEKFVELENMVTIKLNKWKNSRLSRDGDAAKDDAV